MYVCVWYSFVHVVRLGPLDYTHKAQNSLQPRKSLSKPVVCPPLPGLNVLSRGVNVTCSRQQRKAHRVGFEPGTLWSET